MAYTRISFFLNCAIIIELYWQGCGYLLEGYWKAKYRDTLLIKLLLFLNTLLSIINLYLILDVSLIYY